MVFETWQQSEENFDANSAKAFATNVAENNSEMLTDDASPAVTNAMESGGKVPSIEELSKDLGDEPDILALLASAPDGKTLDTWLASMQNWERVIANGKLLRVKERKGKPPVSEVKSKITEFLKESIVRTSATGNPKPISYSSFTSFDGAFKSAKPNEDIYTSKDGNNKNNLEYNSFPNLMKSLVAGLVSADLKPLTWVPPSTVLILLTNEKICSAYPSLYCIAISKIYFSSSWYKEIMSLKRGVFLALIDSIKDWSPPS